MELVQHEPVDLEVGYRLPLKHALVGAEILVELAAAPVAESACFDFFAMTLLVVLASTPALDAVLDAVDTPDAVKSVESVVVVAAAVVAVRMAIRRLHESSTLTCSTCAPLEVLVSFQVLDPLAEYKTWLEDPCLGVVGLLSPFLHLQELPVQFGLDQP